MSVSDGISINLKHIQHLHIIILYIDTVVYAIATGWIHMSTKLLKRPCSLYKSAPGKSKRAISLSWLEMIRDDP